MKKLKVKLQLDDKVYDDLVDIVKKGNTTIDEVASSIIIETLFPSKLNAVAQNTSKSMGGFVYKAYSYWLSKKNELKFNRSEFTNKFMNDASYKELFKAYVASGYDTSMRPSFVYHKKLSKVSFCTYSERMQRLAAASGKPIRQLHYEKKVKDFHSIKQAAKELNIDIKMIRKSLKTVTTGAPKALDFVHITKDEK